MKRKLIRNNLDEVMRVLFRHYGLRYDGFAKHLYHAHPRYRHVEAISYVLSRHGIDSALIETDSSELKSLPFPLVINYDGLFLPINGVGEDGAFIILNEKGNQEEIQLEATDKFWNHLALVFEKDGKGQGGLRYEKTRWLYKRCALILSCMIVATLIACLSVKSFLLGSWLRNFFLLSSFAGIAISVLFHIQRLDRGNPFVNKICHASSSHASKRDCSSILDSTASKFFGLISWVDVGSLYFIVFLVVIWAIPTQGAVTCLAMISLLALLYVPYSIIYQAQIARRWCPLCLSVQAVLLCNAITALSYILKDNLIITDLLSDAAKVMGIALLVTITYTVLITLLSGIIILKTRDKTNREYLFSPNGLQSLIYRTPEAKFASSSRMSVIDNGGNAELTMIINPLCSPCMRKTREVLEIIKRKRYTSLSVIFLVDPHAKTETAHAKKLITAYLTGPMLAALDKHVRRFPGVGDGEGVCHPKAQGILEAQYAWCMKNNYASTPKLFLNNHELSNLFSISDIDFLTE